MQPRLIKASRKRFKRILAQIEVPGVRYKVRHQRGRPTFTIIAKFGEMSDQMTVPGNLPTLDTIASALTLTINVIERYAQALRIDAAPELTLVPTAIA